MSWISDFFVIPAPDPESHLLPFRRYRKLYILARAAEFSFLYHIIIKLNLSKFRISDKI